MSNKSTRVILVIIVVVAAAAGAYYYRNRSAQSRDTGQPVMQAEQVQRGDLSLSADGSGELVAGDEAALAFRAGGVLTELSFEVGDRVQAGDVIARVDKADAQKALVAAQIQLIKAQLDLASAEANLLSLTEGPSEAELLAAKASLASAQTSYERLVSGPDEREIEKAQLSLDQSKNSLWSSQLSRDSTCGRPEGNCDSAKVSVANSEISLRRAELDLEALLEPATDVELADATAKVAEAQEHLDDLSAGPSDDDIANAEGQLEQARLNETQAELNLEAALQDVEDTALVATMSGTVMSVSAKLGDKVGSSALVTIADMDSPQVLFWVEEADLDSVIPGNAVNIIFEALPDYTFAGQILKVAPALVTVSNTPAVEVLASVDLGTNPITLLAGMNAEVEVIAAEATNVLLVPVQALRELGTDQYAVFIVGADGELELRPVQLGLKDFVYAEVVSGLEEGEVVRTGEAATTSSAASDQGAQQGPGGLGGMFFPGGR